MRTLRMLHPAQRARLIDGSIVVVGASLMFSVLRHPPFTPTLHRLAPASRITGSEAGSLAVAALRRTQDNPEDLNAWAQLAIARYHQGLDHYAEGLNALEKARSLGAVNTSFFYYAGLMYEGLGLADYAVHELEMYNRNFPGQVEIWQRLGNLYSRQSKYAEAEVYYRRVMDHRSKDPTVWFNYALACKGLSRWDDALQALQHAHELAGTLPEGGEYERGEIYRLKGELDKSLPCYQRELESHPAHLPSLQALEADARRAGRWKEVRQWREKIQAVKNEPKK